MDKTPHELFMEAAAVASLAVTIFAADNTGRRWSVLEKSERTNRFNEARRLITENMETRHDG